MLNTKLVRLAFVSGVLAIVCPVISFATTYTVVARVPVDPPALNGIEDVLAVDNVGRLVGTQSGTNGGQVFVLIPKGTQGLKFEAHTLFSFAPYARSGPSDPHGGVAALQGRLVGPFTVGGPGCGGIYQLDNPDDPGLSVLHYFAGVHVSPPDGSCPQSGLTKGLGNYLYGTTIETSREGPTVFGIGGSAAAPAYQVIHRFGAQTSPTHANLAVDSRGRIFGALGEAGFGTSGVNTSGGVFAMEYLNGGWKEQLIYAFNPGGPPFQLGRPTANVAIDAQGNLYGCAEYGFYVQGGIFRLAPPIESGGTWAYSAVYNFGAAPFDPNPTSINTAGFGSEGCGITIDPATNIIYGTSYGGGAYNYGTIFSLTPPPPGQTQWTETIIHSFTNSYFDGAYPVAPPLKVGNTYYGGTTTGSVYAFQP